MSNIRDCQCRKLHEGPCPQPAPSGDEAKVREIALRWSEKFDLSSGARMVGAVREAYAAGKADALKVLDERIANMRGGPRLAEAREIRDAIARRGSEGKEDRGGGAWKPTCAEHTDVDCESECIGRIRCSRECGVGDATPVERHRWGCAKASALRARRGSEGK